jgi:hypothetical protein
MFLLKQALDLKVDAALELQENKLGIKDKAMLYALNTQNNHTSSSLSSLICNYEYIYMNASNYSAKFNKLHLSDLSSASNSQDIYTSLILENSIGSSLSSANATR